MNDSNLFSKLIYNLYIQTYLIVDKTGVDEMGLDELGV